MHGGSCDFESKDMSTLIRTKSSRDFSNLVYNPVVTKSHDPLSDPTPIFTASTLLAMPCHQAAAA